MANSPPVISNQNGIHDDLLKVVSKHLNKQFRRPIADHSATAFRETNEIVQQFNGPVIVDSGCGTGESSYKLSEQYPDRLIVGIDKSAARLAKSPNKISPKVCLVRGDLVDMWRLINEYNWPVEKHVVFYPNPWPKKHHLKRRWHGHPIFLNMLQLSNKHEVRTNWQIYALEFMAAVEYLIRQGRFTGQVSHAIIEADAPVSLFEKKYAASQHRLFRIVVEGSSG